MLKSVKALLLAVSLIANGAFAAEYKASEVIVKYKDGAARNRVTMNSLYQFVGVKKVQRFTGMMTGYEKLTLEENIKVEDAIADLERSSLVEYAQPNYILRLLPSVTAADTLADPPSPPGGGLPCIPGMDVPNCDPNIKLPCIFPGVPFPPGCEDSGGGGGDNPLPIPTPAPNPTQDPPLADAPADVNPPVADPSLDKTYGLSKIGAIDAWKSHRGSKDMIVAVIDTGVDYNHEDLSFNMWRNPNPTKNDIVGYDFINDDGMPYDDQGHGTHTSGTVGAVGGNGKGVSGVSQRVSIMGVKFLSAQGSGTTADAIRSIDYAVAHGARILSNSWGGSGDEDNKALYDSIERAKAAGVLFIAAAGNDGVNNDNSRRRSYPASFDNDNLISVAATDTQDKLAFFSNYGEKTTHVAAPGVNIYSTLPGNRYKQESGTSMACPHVAGAAALIWSKNPSLTYKQVKDILMNTADKVPELAGKTISGGRINVMNALRSME